MNKKSYGTVSTPLHNARMAARHLRIGIQTFYKLIAEGVIKPDYFIGKRGFFTEEYLDKVRTDLNG